MTLHKISNSRSVYSCVLLYHAFLLIVPPIDVLSSGQCSILQNLEDDNLKDLAKALPTTVLRSRASSTTSKYLGGFKIWKRWATECRLPVFPALSTHVALYLQHSGQSKGSKAAAEEAVNSISWANLW